MKKSKLLGGYYDPPFKCRVPKSKKKCLEALGDKGLRGATSQRLFGDFLEDSRVNCIFCKKNFAFFCKTCYNFRQELLWNEV